MNETERIARMLAQRLRPPKVKPTHHDEGVKKNEIIEKLAIIYHEDRKENP